MDVYRRASMLEVNLSPHSLFLTFITNTTLTLSAFQKGIGNPLAYPFETVGTFIGVIILMALVIGLVYWHIRFKHPSDDRFLKFWRYPITRILTSITSLCLNIYFILEDPTIGSRRNIDLGLSTLAIRFVFVDWPQYYPFCALKVVFVVLSLVASFGISVYIIHHRLLRDKLNLEMFEKSKGTTIVTAICLIPLVGLWAVFYNGIISLLRQNSDIRSHLPYVKSTIPISYHIFGLITSTITGLSCCISLVMIVDIMLQDPSQYSYWCQSIRPFWSIYRQPLSWSFQGMFSAFWFIFIWGGGIKYYGQSETFKFMRTTEGTRCFVLGLSAACDICSMTQDWEFPSFEDPLELKLAFLDVSKLTFFPRKRRWHAAITQTKGIQQSNALVAVNQVTADESDTWETAADNVGSFLGLKDVVLSGKWFNYGALLINLYGNINRMFQTIFFRPVVYAQYIQPDSKALWTIVDEMLANASIRELQKKAVWEERIDYRNPNVLLNDVELHARFVGGSALAAAIISGVPLLLGFSVFLESLRKYNRHPDDVRRRCQLRAQKAMRKLRNVMGFVSLLDTKNLSPLEEDYVDPKSLQEIDVLLPNGYREDFQESI